MISNLRFVHQGYKIAAELDGSTFTVVRSCPLGHLSETYDPYCQALRPVPENARLRLTFRIE